LNRNGNAAQRAGTRVAIVTPWFGPGLRGGAEQQSLQLAEHLAAAGHRVDVLTTCCPSFGDDWGRNVLRAGVERTGAVTVRRFRTDKRDRRDFERVNAILLSLDIGQLHRAVPPVGDDDAESFSRNNINSTALYAYLASEGNAYDRIIFIPYMFGTTLTGLPLVADRAYLQPCLHREAYAFLPRVAAAVHAAKGLLFNSEGEFELAAWLFGPGIIAKSSVVGEGVDVFAERDRFPERVGEFAPARERYVLYLGRQDPAKNIATLVAAFKRFRRRAPASTLRLVLAGERHVSYGDSSAGIVDLGPVSECEKSALLANCRALAQPSVNESFSRAIYEAWSFGRPVMVHADCPPTATVVTRSGGGYLATSADTWEDALHRIDSASDAALDELGRRGAACAREITSWPAVVERYERAFATKSPAALPGNPERWDVMPDLPLVSALADGKANLLYAGPVVMVEHLEALLVVFLHYLTMDREARLTIAATAVDDTVYAALQAEARRLDIVDRLLLARDLAPAQVQSLFLGADAFVSLNPAEDGAQELLSALWFDVPILARDTNANRAVAKGAAILLGDTSDLLAVATLAQLLVTDRAVRDAVVSAGRAVRLGSREPHGVADLNIAAIR
jgi:glycosyltransferase involved in cell wall biosynthesis